MDVMCTGTQHTQFTCECGQCDGERVMLQVFFSILSLISWLGCYYSILSLNSFLPEMYSGNHKESVKRFNSDRRERRRR